MSEKTVYSRDGLTKSVVTSRDVVGTPEHYRRLRQDIEPIIEHVRHTAQKVNSAPASGNRNGWQYLGSIPITMVIDWCQKNNVRFDEFARNENGAREKFKKAFLTDRSLSKLAARSY